MIGFLVQGVIAKIMQNLVWNQPENEIPAE